MEQEQPRSAEEKHSLYFSLFKGGVVRQSALFEQSPELVPTVGILIDRGLVKQKRVVVDDLEVSEDYILEIDRDYYVRKNTAQE